MEQKIVIAIDYSIQSQDVIKYYLEKLHRPGNKIVLVHCVELPELSLSKAKDSHMSPGVLATMWKEEELKLKELEQKMAALLKEKGVPGVLRTLSGRPGEIICQVAQEEKAVMIVTGAKGVGKMRRTILGSVSDYLVNHALCPVMVCRDEAERGRNNRSSFSTGAENIAKLRHVSGESITSFTASLRQRFASGGKSRSQSTSSEKEETKAIVDKKENRDPVPVMKKT